MNQTATPDSELTDISALVGLRFPVSSVEWTNQAKRRLDVWRFEKLQAERAALARAPETEASFYDYVASDAEVLCAMLEGRLGYYAAVLQRIAALVRPLPHATILDLGSYAGLSTLYLAKLLPDARVTGLDRCAGALAFARRWQSLAKLDNVQWLEADYRRHSPTARFDIVLSLQTTPTYLLPGIPSESPGSYARGKVLSKVDLLSASPAGAVLESLTAISQWNSPSGHSIFHERVASISRALLLFYLVQRAGLHVTDLEMLSWQTANEREGVQTSPLMTAAHTPPTTRMTEDRLIDLLVPATIPADAIRPEFDQGAVFHGSVAHSRFRALSANAADMCVQLLTREQLQFHIHLGVAAGSHAYVFTSGTEDLRELKICHKMYVRQLFEPVVVHLIRQTASGELLRVHPPPEQLIAILHARFGY